VRQGGIPFPGECRHDECRLASICVGKARQRGEGNSPMASFAMVASIPSAWSTEACAFCIALEKNSILAPPDRDRSFQKKQKTHIGFPRLKPGFIKKYFYSFIKKYFYILNPNSNKALAFSIHNKQE
jgi:hypothetical protein